MSENRDRRTDRFSKYDSMPTEALEEILRLDAEAPDGQESDTELLLYVMEVLANRRRNTNVTGNTAQQAWESFRKYYLPQEEEIPYTPEQPKPVKAAKPWLRRLIAAVVAIALLICIPVASSAFGWQDIWNAVAKWAKETFSFVSGDDRESTEPAPQDTMQFGSLQEALTATGLPSDFIPTWIPEGYTLDDVTLSEIPGRKAYIACYNNDNNELIIKVQAYLNDAPEKVEINQELLETYSAANVDYYIFENNEQLRAVWIHDSYECYISGELTVAEIKTMIDSIGKG